MHRLLVRHDISRLPDVDGDKPKRKKFKPYPIGYLHIDIAEVRTEDGKLYMFVAIDRTSIRVCVEHVFGYEKGPMAITIRSIGQARAAGRITMANLSYNFRHLVFHERRQRP